MNQHHHDTIFALSTPMGQSGVAVIRLSGPKSLYAIRQMISPLVNNENHDHFFMPRPRYAYYKTCFNPFTYKAIDHALLIYFPAPNSFTGEDIVEIQCHGSIAVIQEFIEVLGRINGLRHALPGEFTRRAFDNQKLDLLQVEALDDLIHAETKLQKNAAMHVMDGYLKRAFEDLRVSIIGLGAHIEASIDFVDEEDVPEEIMDVIGPLLLKTENLVKKMLCDYRASQKIKNGFKVALVGEPNVGKSTIMNAMSKDSISIVSSIEGTTRDRVSNHLDVGGFPVTLFDTAGIRTQTEDEIEKIGIDITYKTIQEADLVLWVVDHPDKTSNIPDMLGDCDPRKIILLINKEDIWSIDHDGNKNQDQGQGQTEDQKGDDQKASGFHKIYALSAKNQGGVHEVLASMADFFQKNALDIQSENHFYISHQRHAMLLENMQQELSKIRQAYGDDDGAPKGIALDLELVAEHIRTSIYYVESLIGYIDVEDYLDKIFKDFCIGK